MSGEDLSGRIGGAGISAFGFSPGTEDLNFGLDVLDEHLAARRWAAREQREELLEPLDRTVRWVEQEEYGLTQVGIDRERYERELSEEEGEGEY